MSALKIKFMVWVISALIYMLAPSVKYMDRKRAEYLVQQGEKIIDELVNFDGGDI